MIMRFRPANIRLINRRSNLPRLLLALSSRKSKGNYKNIPTDSTALTRSLHIRDMHLLRIHARQLVTEEPLLELIDSDFRSAVGHQNISEGAEPRFASPCRVFGILPSVPMKAPRCL